VSALHEVIRFDQVRVPRVGPASLTTTPLRDYTNHFCAHAPGAHFTISATHRSNMVVYDENFEEIRRLFDPAEDKTLAHDQFRSRSLSPTILPRRCHSYE
jgi:hypothetical protein